MAEHVIPGVSQYGQDQYYQDALDYFVPQIDQALAARYSGVADGFRLLASDSPGSCWDDATRARYLKALGNFLVRIGYRHGVADSEQNANVQAFLRRYEDTNGGRSASQHLNVLIRALPIEQQRQLGAS